MYPRMALASCLENMSPNSGLIRLIYGVSVSRTENEAYFLKNGWSLFNLLEHVCDTQGLAGVKRDSRRLIYKEFVYVECIAV